jgi:hypothetical protein
VRKKMVSGEEEAARRRKMREVKGR